MIFPPKSNLRAATDNPTDTAEGILQRGNVRGLDNTVMRSVSGQVSLEIQGAYPWHGS